MTRAGDAPKGYLRVSFLVNVWLDYKPTGIEPFPEEELDNLGLSPPLGTEGERALNESFLKRVQTTIGLKSRAHADDGDRVQDGDVSASSLSFEVVDSSDAPAEACTTFEYKFGETGTEHLLRVQVPLPTLTDAAKRGDVVELRWGNQRTPRAAVAEVVAQEHTPKMKRKGTGMKDVSAGNKTRGKKKPRR